MFLLAAGLFLWKLASPETFLGFSVEALSGGVVALGAGLLLSIRVDRGRGREVRRDEGSFVAPAGSE